MHRLRSAAALIALAFALSSCLLVDDFGEAWNQSLPDPCINRFVSEIYYTDFRRNPEGKEFNKLARVLTINGHSYLLLKKSVTDKGGRLYRFTVAPGSVGGGIFQRWRLDPSMRETFLKNYPNAPVSVTRDTVTLKTLDEATEKLLVEISDKPEYWQIEDQTLYNPLHDDSCRFDSGPLDALPPENIPMPPLPKAH